MATLRLPTATLAASLFVRFSVAQPPGFLLVSQPHLRMVSWVPLPSERVEQTQAQDQARAPRVLIDNGLQHPQGIAVDSRRKVLLVADPDVRRIYGYDLAITKDSVAITGGRFIVAKGFESRWVAVDGGGNIVFSDEPRNLILKIQGGRPLRSGPVPEVIFDGRKLKEVSQPGGVAADNMHVFWTNKHFGTSVGSVVKGPELLLNRSHGGAMIRMGSEKLVNVLARNSVKSYGVCVALGNVYFTDDRQFIYGVRKAGGPTLEVSSEMNRPRGCVWDGDGTVFVADRGQNAVFSFPSGMRTAGKAHLSRALDIEDPFGVAVALVASGVGGAGRMWQLMRSLAVAALVAGIFSFQRA